MYMCVYKQTYMYTPIYVILYTMCYIYTDASICIIPNYVPTEIFLTFNKFNDWIKKLLVSTIIPIKRENAMQKHIFL